MRFLTIEEVEAWCNAHDLKIGADRFLYYEVENPHSFSVVIEDNASRVIVLADYLVPTWEDVPFSGALLWIRERGMGEDYSEKTGAMILRQMRLGNGEREFLEKRPGYLFGADEVFEMHSYLVVAMLFGWDIFLMPEGREYYLLGSHDGLVTVVSRTRQEAEVVYRRVLTWGPVADVRWDTNSRLE